MTPVGAGDVTAISKIFQGKYGSSSLGKDFFPKSSTNYFSLPKLMLSFQYLDQAQTSGHLFYMEEILLPE